MLNGALIWIIIIDLKNNYYQISFFEIYSFYIAIDISHTFGTTQYYYKKHNDKPSTRKIYIIHTDPYFVWYYVNW